MRTAAAVLLLSCLMLVGGDRATGFSCIPRDPRAAPTEAMGGRWTVVEGVIEAESFFGIRFRVERVYAGETARTITLPGQSNANRVGQPWTFYVSRNPIAYDYTDCGGSHPGPLTPEERDVLGPGTDPAADGQGFGLLGNLGAAAVVGAALVLFARRSRRRPPLSPAGAHP